MLPLLIIAPAETIISHINSNQGLCNIIIMAMSTTAAMISYRFLKKISDHKIIALMMSISVIALGLYALFPNAFTEIAVCALIGWVAGSIDYFLQLNILQNYEFSHMNWLHSAWGIGAAVGVLIRSINKTWLELKQY